MSAWQCMTPVEVAMSLLAERECRLAPDHGSDDQLDVRNNSDAACTEAVALHTVHSVADTHTHGRRARRKRTATAKSSAYCSSISAAYCRCHRQVPDSFECLHGYEQKHLHSRTFAAA